jgi:hypothetical protein
LVTKGGQVTNGRYGPLRHSFSPSFSILMPPKVLAMPRKEIEPRLSATGLSDQDIRALLRNDEWGASQSRNQQLVFLADFAQAECSRRILVRLNANCLRNARDPGSRSVVVIGQIQQRPSVRSFRKVPFLWTQQKKINGQGISAFSSDNKLSAFRFYRSTSTSHVEPDDMIQCRKFAMTKVDKFALELRNKCRSQSRASTDAKDAKDRGNLSDSVGQMPLAVAENYR